MLRVFVTVSLRSISCQIFFCKPLDSLPPRERMARIVGYEQYPVPNEPMFSHLPSSAQMTGISLLARGMTIVEPARMRFCREPITSSPSSMSTGESALLKNEIRLMSGGSSSLNSHPESLRISSSDEISIPFSEGPEIGWIKRFLRKTGWAISIPLKRSFMSGLLPEVESSDIRPYRVICPL